MKKILVVLCVMLLAASGAFAAPRGTGWAVGGEASLYIAGNGGLPAGAMFLLHIPGIPIMFGAGINSPFSVGLTADYWFARGNLVSILDYYVGVGAYAQIFTSPSNVELGGRVPFGLQLWPVGHTLEIFLELAPAFGVSVDPTQFAWHLQGAVGLRFWF